jgi:hypothetical protein
MDKQTKPTTITDGELTAKVRKGKFGEYSYKSPKCGYKRAHKFDRIADIYHGEHKLKSKGFKGANKKEIKEYMGDWAKSPEGKVLIKRAKNR